jgi:ribosome-binding factor A
MRSNPRVRFRYDDSWEVGEEITSTINALDIETLENKMNL